MKKTGWITVTLALLVYGTQMASAESLSAEREQQLIRDVFSIYEPTSPLLETGETQEIHKCGFGIMAQVRLLWPQLSAETRELLKEYSERPIRQKSYNVPGISICIHYDTTGADSVDMRHGLDTDGVPIYVKRVAIIYQEIWQREIVEMGFPPPPGDNGKDGSSAYDVYLTSLSSTYYGMTHGDSTYQDGTDGKMRMTSYVELDNDYQGYSLYPPDEWVQILSVTAAHEYFHAIQYGIDAYEFLENAEDYSGNVWWHEQTATWMEDMVYDNVNDYYYYLPGFFDHPNWALTSQYKGNYEYGACVWPRYLSERFGEEIIHDIWEQCGEKTWLNSIEAWVDQLQARGSSLREELGRFRTWCFFSGERYEPFAFQEGQNYPTIDEETYLHEYTVYPVQDTISKLIAPAYMGTTYLKFVRPILGDISDFKIQIEYLEKEQWVITAAGLKDNSAPDMFSAPTILNPLVVPNWQQYESIMVMPMPYDEDFSRAGQITARNFSYVVADTLQGVNRDTILTIFPNPYTIAEGSVTIIVDRLSKGETEVFIYNTAGELIRGGRNERTSTGNTPFYVADGEGEISETFYWNGRNRADEIVASGVYLCLVRLGEEISLQKLAAFRQ